MTPRVFAKLLALFVVLLVFQTVVMEFVFRGILERAGDESFHLLAHEALWSGLIAFAVALPVAALVARRVTQRLQQVVAFSRRIADGELTARLPELGDDELSAMEAALNRTAERLGQSFAEIENRRQEQAAILDSRQDAQVAVSPDGQVRW